MALSYTTIKLFYNCLCQAASKSPIIGVHDNRIVHFPCAGSFPIQSMVIYCSKGIGGYDQFGGYLPSNSKKGKNWYSKQII
jgi:hypothetical protein